MNTIAVSNDKVRAHYDVVGLIDRVQSAVLGIAPADARIKPEQLAGLDQFHTRGLPATIELADAARLSRGDHVLDLGCGLGGPARLLASRYGVSVLGIDLSAPFIDAGRYLNERCGLEGSVKLEVGDATDIRRDDASFDAAFLLHVSMNIADRSSLYREVARVLRPRGRLVTFDVVRGAGEVILPVPWAREPGTSHLLSSDETRAAMEREGLVIEAWRDDTESAVAWFVQLSMAGGPPPGPNLGVVMGEDFRLITGNLGRNLREGRARIVSGIARSTG